MSATDIYTLNVEEIPNFDLLCAGFPCQPFSSAGNKLGFEDKRGGMIFKIIDICTFHKPKTVILENVYNLMTLCGGKYMLEITNMFKDIGYTVHSRKINSSEHGLPQSRERVFIVCTLSDETVPTVSVLDKLVAMKPVKLDDFIDNTDHKSNIKPEFAKRIIELHAVKQLYGCKIGDKRGGEKNIHSWDVGTQGIVSLEERTLMEKIMLERRKKHWAEKKKMVWMDGIPLTKEDILTFVDDSESQLQILLNALVEKKYLKMERCKDLVDGKRIYRNTGDLGYNICKGKLSFPVSKILDPVGIAPTLTATDCNKLAVIIDNKYLRNLNELELKRLCGFPSSFVIPKGVNKYDLFGNMVTPPVITAIMTAVFA